MFRSNATEFSQRLSELLRRERGGMAEFLIALGEFHRELLWEELGYTSLFMYLHRELGLSRGSAFYRMTAADLLREYPDLIEPLRDGRLCMTAVVELSKVITPENRGVVVPRFFHLSKAEAREVSAALAPVRDPPRRDVVTVLSPTSVVRPGEPLSPLRPNGTPPLAPPAAPLTPGSSLERDLTAADLAISANPMLHVEPAAALARAFDCTPVPVCAPGPPRDVVEPLTAAVARLHTTVSRQFLDKLEAARNALSHSKPGASMGDILEAGLDLVVAQHDRRKGLVKKPRAMPRRSASDATPAHVKRAVWKRDGGCCQWKLPSGQICGSRTRVQFDHITPRALGGESTVENVRLLCGPHNRLAARRVLGDACVDRHVKRPPRARRLDRQRGGVGPGGG